MTKPRTATTLADALAAELRSSILRGDVPPGTKLRLGDLRARFGVSLSPLREALSRLAAERVVMAESQRGYRVPEVSLEGLAEVNAIRCHIEPFALAESIRRGDDAWEEKLVALFHRLTKFEQHRTTRVEDWEAAHRDFHGALIAACQMPLLLQFCTVLHDLSDRYRRHFLAKYPLDRDVHAEHHAIFDAALARDVEKASGLLKQHVMRTGTNILQVMERDARQRTQTAPRRARRNGARTPPASS
jgi:GntR family carbon starvation induced transcriptional regulator